MRGESAGIPHNYDWVEQYGVKAYKGDGPGNLDHNYTKKCTIASQSCSIVPASHTVSSETIPRTLVTSVSAKPQQTPLRRRQASDPSDGPPLTQEARSKPTQLKSATSPPPQLLEPTQSSASLSTLYKYLTFPRTHPLVKVTIPFCSISRHFYLL